MHRSDIIKQKIMPTIMVPQKSDLPLCEPGQARFLMASDGLYLEALTPWGHFVKQLWDSLRAVPLPYGQVEEVNDFVRVLNIDIMPIIEREMLEKAAEYAERGKEWAGFVVFDGENFRPWFEEFTATAYSVKFATNTIFNLPQGLYLVADVHSHHTMTPHFSAGDDESDQGKIKISIVLGNYRRENGKPVFDWKARFCVRGFFFDERTPLFMEEETDDQETRSL